MADEEQNLDSDSTDQDPVGAGSQGDQDLDRPISRAEFNKAVGELTSTIGGLKDSLKQSNRDVIQDSVGKEVQPLREEISALASVLERHPELLKEGLDKQAVLRNAALDSIVAGVLEPNDKSPSESPKASDDSGSPSEDKTLESGIGEILAKHSLTGKEPELMEYMSESKGKPLFSTLQGLDSLAEKIARRSAGDAGSILPVGSGARTPRPDLVESYAKEAYAAQGDPVKFKAIKAKYAELFKKAGMDINKVNLVR